MSISMTPLGVRGCHAFGTLTAALAWTVTGNSVGVGVGVGVAGALESRPRK